MKALLKSAVRSFRRPRGSSSSSPAGVFPPDFSPAVQSICTAVGPYTMTTPERIQALVAAVEYVSRHSIAGDIVECGVWKGGSAMAAAIALQNLSDTRRDIYLYDTYAGMSEPSELDVDHAGRTAAATFESLRFDSGNGSDWCFSPLESVRANVLSTGYPADRFHFIQGKVEETIPASIPERIAILRLDTDWYESTRHELIHLFPLLQPGGVLIIDDYGHWDGARRAVDEYFAKHQVPILLNRIDYTGRVGIKLR